MDQVAARRLIPPATLSQGPKHDSGRACHGRHVQFRLYSVEPVVVGWAMTAAHTSVLVWQPDRVCGMSALTAEVSLMPPATASISSDDNTRRVCLFSSIFLAIFVFLKGNRKGQPDGLTETQLPKSNIQRWCYI
jgi:hypothetical protein